MTENLEQKGRSDGHAAASSMVNLDKMSEDMRKLYVLLGKDILCRFMTAESHRLRLEGAIPAQIAVYVGSAMTAYDESAALMIERAASGPLN